MQDGGKQAFQFAGTFAKEDREFLKIENIDQDGIRHLFFQGKPPPYRVDFAGKVFQKIRLNIHPGFEEYQEDMIAVDLRPAVLQDGALGLIKGAQRYIPLGDQQFFAQDERNRVKRDAVFALVDVVEVGVDLLFIF